MPPADAGAVAKRAPRTSVGQDVAEGDLDLEEEEEEEDEVAAEGNSPAEILKRALEVGLLEEDELVERWFTDTGEAGDPAHGVHGVVVVRLALGEEDRIAKFMARSFPSGCECASTRCYCCC